MLQMRALPGLVVVLGVACSVLEPVSDYEGPALDASDSDGAADVASGGSVGDATTTDAKCSTPSDCDDADPCTLDGCWGDLCTHAPISGEPCSDGNVCNGAESCDAGKCVPGKPPSVDDGNPCTDDACDPVKGVTHTPQASPPMQILQCGSVECPSGYYVKKLTCLTECGPCNPMYCVNGSLCERACGPKLAACCNADCGDDCPPGYSLTATSYTGDCGCGPGLTGSCQR